MLGVRKLSPSLPASTDSNGTRSRKTPRHSTVPLGQDYEPKDFEVLDEFLESTDDLPEPTREFESQTHPPPDDFKDHPDTKEEPPRSPSPAIPQPRISPRKIRRDWTRARDRFSPDPDTALDDHDEMGSNNEEDLGTQSTFPLTRQWTQEMKTTRLTPTSKQTPIWNTKTAKSLLLHTDTPPDKGDSRGAFWSS